MDVLAIIRDSAAHSGPLLLLLLTGLMLMLFDAFKLRKALPWIAGAGLLGSALWAWTTRTAIETEAFWGMIAFDGMAGTIHVLLCMAGLFALFFIQDYFRRQETPIPDVYALLVFATIGMILMANARDLIITFIGLETMSISLYIMAALYKMDLRSNEAGLKYFLLGSFASAFLLLGIALIYGLSGTTGFTEIQAGLQAQVSGLQAGQQDTVLLVAAGLILVGFLFKVAAFPFHSWAPDVYQGAPTPLAGFMATGSKMAAFVGFSIILMQTGLIEHHKIKWIVAAAAVASMVYGNVAALRQENIKRLLAYSSIAHSGYVLLAVLAGKAGFQAVVFYMFIYTLMNTGAFGLVSMRERDPASLRLENWRGIGLTAPAFGVAMAVFMLSLTGIPPFAGFIAKYFVFTAAIKAGYTWLAVIGILASVAGAVYYLRVISLMFFSKTMAGDLRFRYGMAPAVGVVLLMGMLIWLGLFPGSVG